MGTWYVLRERILSRHYRDMGSGWFAVVRCGTARSASGFSSVARGAVMFRRLPHVMKEFRHERRHSRLEIGRAAHDADAGELRGLLAGEEGENSCAQRRRRLGRAQHLHHGDAAAVENRAPARFRMNRVGGEPGLLAKLAQHAALEID